MFFHKGIQNGNQIIRTGGYAAVCVDQFAADAAIVFQNHLACDTDTAPVCDHILIAVDQIKVVVHIGLGQYQRLLAFGQIQFLVLVGLYTGLRRGDLNKVIKTYQNIVVFIQTLENLAELIGSHKVLFQGTAVLFVGKGTLGICNQRLERQIQNGIGVFPGYQGLLAVLKTGSGILQLGIAADIAAESIDQCNSTVEVIACGHFFCPFHNVSHFRVQTGFYRCHGFGHGDAGIMLNIFLLDSSGNGADDKDYDQQRSYRHNNQRQGSLLENLLLGTAGSLGAFLLRARLGSRF